MPYGCLMGSFDAIRAVICAAMKPIEAGTLNLLTVNRLDCNRAP